MEHRGCHVSVIISSYNRASQLSNALDALCTQQGGVSYEVVVVDNNSTDSTAAVVNSRRLLHPHLRYVFEPRQGLPFARNTGVMAAQASILAFTDDDVVVGPEWVSTIKRIFDAHPDIDMLGGRVRPIWPASVPAWVTPRQMGPFALGERGDTPQRVNAENAAPCLVGANFAFRRTVFDRVGLFDHGFVKSQDREIQLRLWRAGGTGLYCPELVIDVVIPAERLTKKYFRYWYGIYGVYHSRMGLLDIIDRDGRLVQPRGRRFLGAPAFLYRRLLQNVWHWCTSIAQRDATAAFEWENHVRYLFSYLRDRVRERRAGHTAPPPAPQSAWKTSI